MRHRAPGNWPRGIPIIIASSFAVLCIIGAVLAFALTRHDSHPSATTASAPPASSTASTQPASPSTSGSPASSADASGASTSLAGKVFVIDPGHNEHNAEHTKEISKPVDVITETKPCDETGTETNDGYTEAAFTTDVANRVAALLQDQGATVVLTRDASTPWGPCIDQRALIGNNAHADAAISIHADGGPVDGHGFEVIEPVDVPGHNDAIIAPSHALALDVRDAYAAATGLPFANYIGKNGIDDRNDLGGLNLSTVPKVFIETGNMRNAGDAAKLEDSDFRQQVAIGIARGLVTFASS